MANEKLIIDLADFLDSGEGERETYIVDTPFQPKETEFVINSDVKLRVTLMRLKEGIHVQINELTCQVSSPCIRCGKQAETAVNIKNIERIFYFHPPKEMAEDPFDLYLVDMENSEIDLAELLRQEITLHLPDSILCSDSCHGICPHCGKELNLASCSCKKEKITTSESGIHKPLSKLKELFAESQKPQNN